MPTITIVKPVVTEEENEKRKKELYEVLTKIAYKTMKEDK